MSSSEVGPIPRVGDRAPVSEQLMFPSEKPVVLVFLRGCGDPFTEKLFTTLTALSTTHPNLHCIAVSHFPKSLTERWIIQVGGEWNVTVLIDPDRALYKQWGLGEEGPWEGLWERVNPWTWWAVYQLGRDEGIWGTGRIQSELGEEEREGSADGNESQSKGAQKGGTFAVDASGFVRWIKIPSSPEDLPDLGEAVRALATAKTGLA